MTESLQISVPTGAELKAEIQELARTASFEILPSSNLDFLERVKPGTRIHITDFSGNGRDAGRTDTIRLAGEFLQKGFIPVPHIAARRVKSRNDLEMMTSRMSAVGVSHVMLIAGDGPPAGEFDCTMSMLETGLMTQFNNVAVAGHPGAGQITIPKADQANDALRHKNMYAAAQKQPMRIVTQLCYDPGQIVKWAKSLPESKIDLPVHVGLTGPATVKQKTRYAELCGIDLTKVLRNQAGSLFKMFNKNAPDGLITAIAKSRLKARHEGNPEIAGMHFFTFNIAPQTVDMLVALENGDFAMNDKNDGFELEPRMA